MNPETQTLNPNRLVVVVLELARSMSGRAVRSTQPRQAREVFDVVQVRHERDVETQYSVYQPHKAARRAKLL